MPVFKTKHPTKDKKSWYFSTYYTDLNGERKKYFSKKFLTKKEAEEAEASFRVTDKKEKISLTFNDLVDDYINYISNRLKDSSVYKIKSRIKLHVIPYFGKMKVNKLTKNQYIDWQNQMNNTNYSPSYKNIIHGLMVSIINHGVKYGKVTQNIPHMVGGFKDDTIKEINFFTYEEFEKFIGVIENIDDITMFSMLYYLGLRKGELQALTWEDVLSDNITIKKTAVEKIADTRWVITSPKTKGSIRTLKMPKRLKDLINQLYLEKSKYKNFSKKWFVFGDHQPICNSTMLRRKNNYCKKADVKQIRIHDFRHSTASLLISKGMDIVKVCDYLGHVDKATTLNVYSHMYQDEKNVIANMIDNL